MKHQDVINWKINQLNQTCEQPLTAEMNDYITAHPELAEELSLIEQFWQTEPPLSERPAASVRTHFYTMLADEKQNLKLKQKNRINTWFDTVIDWFTLPRLAQSFALLAVFTLGLSINDVEVIDPQDSSIAALQQEVASLSSLVAMSMLNRSSASERLSGVSFSLKAGLADPNLTSTLLALLENDGSTAVRLAVINAFAQSKIESRIEDNLISLTVNEKNPLVQIALCRLLFSTGSQNAQSTLNSRLNTINLNQDVSQYLLQINAKNRI